MLPRRIAAESARVNRGEHAADDRDAEGAAEFAGGVVDGRADAGLVGGQRAHDRLGGRRRGQAQTAAEQHHLRGDLQVGVAASTVDAHARPPAKMARPPATTSRGADPFDDAGSDDTGDRDRDGDRQ